MKNFLRKAISGLSIFAVMIIPGPDDWTTHQRDTARSGFVAADVSGGVKLGWAKTTENVFDSPLYQRGVYYFTEKRLEGYSIYAVRKEDNAEIWRYNGTGLLTDPIEVYQDSVLIPGQNLICLDGYSGQIKWQTNGGQNTNYHYLMPDNNSLYFWEGGGLFAADIRTGLIQWQHQFPGVQETSYLTLTPYNDLIAVYYGSDGKTYINYVAATNGYTDSVTVAGRMASPLVINSYDLGFLALDGGRMAVIDTYTMELIREFDFGDQTSLPVTDGETVYFLSKNIANQEVSLNSIFTEINMAEESSPYIFTENKKTITSSLLFGQMPDILMVGEKLFFKGVSNEIWQTSFLDGLKKHKIENISSVKKVIVADREFIVLSGDSKKIVSFVLDPKAESNVVISSPYQTGSGYQQYVGQLHSHYVPDIKIPGQKVGPKDTVSKYKEAGYDFIALTEHNQLISNPGVDGITFIENSEEDTQGWGGNHILGIGIKEPINEKLDEQSRVDTIKGQNGFVSLAHPNSSFYSWSTSDLFFVNKFDALEIYNSGIDKAGKYLEIIKDLSPMDNAFATDKWDQLLSKRKKVFATAGDDYTPNNPGFNNASVVVLARDNSQTEILDNLKNGNFYVIQGTDSPRIEIEVTDKISISSSKSSTFRFIGKGGQVLREEENVSASSYSPQGKEIYVRAEIIDDEHNITWTQPFLIDLPEKKTAEGNGTKSLEMEGASLGADTSDTLEISTQNVDAVPSESPKWGYLSPIYNLVTAGQLAGRATLSINYSPQDLLVNEDNLSIFTFDSVANVWDKVSSIVDKVNKKVIAQLDHFSLYTLSSDLESDTIPPSLDILNAGDLLEVSGVADILVSSTDNNITYNVSGYLDKDTLLFSDSDRSDGFSNSVDFSAYPAGRHTIKIVATDGFGNKTEKEIKTKNSSNSEKPQIKITSLNRNKKSCAGFRVKAVSKGIKTAGTGLIYLDNSLLGEVDLSDGHHQYTYTPGDSRTTYKISVSTLQRHKQIKKIIKIVKSCEGSKRKWTRVVVF